MKNVFWLIENKLAGRCGPDLSPWDVQELRTGGIDAVLSVNSGIHCDPDAFRAVGIVYHRIPMPGNEPPIPEDHDRCRVALPATYEFIREHHARNASVLVHCTAGKDRTGMTMAYYLMREHGLDPDAALRQVRAVRPIALSAQGWEAMGLGVLQRLHEESRTE